MANIAEEVTTTLLVKIIEEHIIVPIKRQLSYLCCFNANVQSLKDESKRLADARAGLQLKVDAAIYNAEVIVPAVQTWLTSTSMIQEDGDKFITDIPNVSFFSFKSRYSLSKKAKVKAEVMAKLRDECQFEGPIAVPAPPAATALVPLPEGYEFESRKQIEDAIMRALKGKDTMVGICGMGGVGKTTMAKKIMNRVRKENLFDETVIAVVSRPVDMEKLQLEIAGYLGLKLQKEEMAKAHKLRVRLTSNTRRTLIVLDDIWEELNLGDLGIPRESGCTILLTSRSRDVLSWMGVQIFAMKVLSEDEAWALFKDRVALPANDDDDLVHVAKQVAQECKGLPVAIVTVGKTLKDKDKSVWNDSLIQLRSSNPTHIPTFLEEVYKPLRLSYDFLKDEQTRSLFLLCSIFREDANIELEKLTWYMVGLGKLERITSLEVAYGRVFRIVDTLKNLNLLLDGTYKFSVRMHDVIRDVAIFIASEMGIADGDCGPTRNSNCDREWISVFPTESNWSFDEYMGCSFPNLCLLSVHFDGWDDIEVTDLSFLEAMKGLNVLSLGRISCEKLPQTMQWPKGLRTLQLENCMIDVISIVGELSCLEILVCVGCGEIEELPVGIGKVKQLKLLKFSYCYGLKRIAPGVISNLVEMEELIMEASFDEWESTKVNEEKRKNASLAELKSLSKLSSLEIHIQDSNLVDEDLHFLSKIKKYQVSIGGDEFEYTASDITYEKSLCMKLSKDNNLGSWIHDCVRSVECLSLRGDGSNQINMSQLQMVRRLEIKSCGSMKNVVNAKSSIVSTLEILELASLPCLEEVVLINEKCHLTFPKLKDLCLWDMSSLTTFCKGVESTEFPLLEELKIVNCPKMRNMICSGGQDDHLFFNTKVKFGGLKSLEMRRLDDIDNLWCSQISPYFFKNLELLKISYIKNVKCLFTSAMVEYLVNIKSLTIEECDQMEYVISESESEMMERPFLKGENGKNEKKSLVVLQTLVKLILMDLPSLISFCSGIEIIEFPLLEEISITDCPNLVNFVSKGNGQSGESFPLLCSKQVTFGRLKTLEIDGCSKLESLFSSAIAEELVNLRELTIWGCNGMQKLIYIEDEKKPDEKHTLFPSLEWLYLHDLPMLKTFCEWRSAIELPMLRKVDIDRSWGMEFFSFGSVHTPKLECIRTNGQELQKNEGDLNENIIEHITIPVIFAVRICDALENAIHTFFENEGFICHHTPIVNMGAEKMFQVTNIFKLNDNSAIPETDLNTIVKEKGEAIAHLKSSKASKAEITNVVAEFTTAMEKFSKKDENFNSEVEFFARQAFLLLSEEMFKSVYTFWPTFPARNSQTSRNHVDFFMVETEVISVDVQDIMNYAEAYVKFLCQWLLDNCYDDMEIIKNTIDEEAIKRLQMVATTKFHRITFIDAIANLEEARKDGKFEKEAKADMNLTRGDKRYLVEEKFKAPIIVYNYPKAIKPFYVKVNEDAKTVAAMEVLVPMVGELLVGSQREENCDLLKKRILEDDLPIEPYEWYLTLKPYGNMKYSGFQLNFKKMIKFATGIWNIKNMVALSRYQIIQESSSVSTETEQGNTIVP